MDDVRLTKPSFDWADPFLLDDQLTEEERMVRDTARDFAQARLQPGITDAYMTDTFNRGLMEEMGALGLLGPTVPVNTAERASATSPTASSRAKWSGSTAATARR